MLFCITLPYGKITFLTRNSAVSVFAWVIWSSDCKLEPQVESVACRGGGRTGRRLRAFRTGGHPKSEITKIKC